jgi:hypothetical protein
MSQNQETKSENGDSFKELHWVHSIPNCQKVTFCTECH